MEQNMLERLHLVELEIMDEFHRICQENDITYFLDSGTALGAVRHKGFIPWDDDMDVGMLRADYEKFICVAKTSINPDFFLQTKETEPNYYKYNAKLRKKNTFFPEDGSINLLNRGIFIDIYPFDYVSNNLKLAKFQVHKARRMLQILRFRQTTDRRASIIKRLLYKCICIIPEEILEREYLRYCAKINEKKSKHLTCYSYKMARTKDLIFGKDELVPVRKTKFENREYYLMENYEKYLTTMYGEYMKLPAESERVCHMSGEVLFELEKQD